MPTGINPESMSFGAGSRDYNHGYKSRITAASRSIPRASHGTRRKPAGCCRPCRCRFARTERSAASTSGAAAIRTIINASTSARATSLTLWPLRQTSSSSFLSGRLVGVVMGASYHPATGSDAYSALKSAGGCLPTCRPANRAHADHPTRRVTSALALTGATFAAPAVKSPGRGSDGPNYRLVQPRSAPPQKKPLPLPHKQPKTPFWLGGNHIPSATWFRQKFLRPPAELTGKANAASVAKVSAARARIPTIAALLLLCSRVVITLLLGSGCGSIARITRVCAKSSRELP